MDDSAYQSLRSNLSATNRRIEAPPVLDEEINDYKLAYKSAIEGIGQVNVAHTLHGVIKQVAKKTGSKMTAEETEGLANDMSEGNFGGAVQKVVSKGLNNLSTRVISFSSFVLSTTSLRISKY